MSLKHKDVVSEEEQEQKDFMTALETGEFQGRGEVHELDQDTFSEYVLSCLPTLPLMYVLSTHLATDVRVTSILVSPSQLHKGAWSAPRSHLG